MNEGINFLKKHLKQDETVVLSSSGGPDSMCLLHLLLSIKGEYNLKIVVAHINHNQREESKEEYEFVKNYSNKNDCIFEGLSITEFENNFQSDARHKRYQFLEKLLAKHKASTLLTAHHGDDLIETVLMRSLRGSKIQGYAGFREINYIKSYKILRPLIFYSKDDILNYNKKYEVPYRVDKSNFGLDYTRNKIRNNILPLLKEMDKNIHKKYYKYSLELLDYYDFIKKHILSKKIIEDDFLNIDLLKCEDEFLVSRSIQIFLSLFQEQYELDVKDNTVLEINKLILSKKDNITVDLSNSFKALKNKGKIYIKRSNTKK